MAIGYWLQKSSEVFVNMANILMGWLALDRVLCSTFEPSGPVEYLLYTIRNALYVPHTSTLKISFCILISFSFSASSSTHHSSPLFNGVPERLSQRATARFTQIFNFILDRFL